MNARRRSVVSALGVAAIAALLAIATTYAVSRVVQGAMSPEPNPALVTAGARIAMFWRLALGAYVGAMCAIPLYSLARRDLPSAVRGLAIALPLAALTLTLQGVLVP